MEHCDNLVLVHQRSGTGQRGHRRIETSVNRAIVVIVIASWQPVVQDMADVVVSRLQARSATSFKRPCAARYQAGAERSAGLDVLIEAEDIERIVFPLDLAEPGEVGAIGSTHELFALLAEAGEVEIDAAPVGVGIHSLPEGTRPGD